MTAKLSKLANGIRIACEPRPGTNIVAMQVYFGSGTAGDSAQKTGLTSLMQEACSAGTTSRTRQEISDALEAKGIAFSSGAAVDQTVFTVTCLADDAPYAFGILADIIRNPSFESAEIDREKTQILQMLAMEKSKPLTLASRQFLGEAFKGQHAGRNPFGDAQTLAALTPDDLRNRHKALLARPTDMVVSIAGDMDPVTAEKLVDTHFGDLQTNMRKRAFKKPHFVGGDSRTAFDNQQLALVFGFEAPSIDDPRRFDFMMLQQLLAGGMSAPLFQEIREKRGLVYGVSAQYTPLNGSGLFRISATTGKGNAGQLISASMDLLGDVARKGFTQDQLNIAVERIISQIESSRERTASVANANGQQLVSRGRLIPPKEIEQMLKRVTPDDVRRAAAELLSQNEYALGGYGPLDTMPSRQEILGMMKAQTAQLNIPPAAPKPPPVKAAFSGAASAQQTGDIAPQVTVLPNGLTVMTFNRPGLASCGAWVRVGSNYENEAEDGITHMIEHMMFKGTKSYPAGSIDKIVENDLRGGLNAYTSFDETAYYFYNLRPDAIAKATDICGEMVFEANLDEKEFSGKIVGGQKGPGERDVVLEEIKQYEDQPQSMTMYRLFELAYPNQAAGRKILGTADSLNAMTAKDLASYRDRFYLPNNIVFAAVGPVDHDAYVKLVEQKYGHLPSAPAPSAPPVHYHGGTDWQEKVDLPSCKIMIAAESKPSDHPDDTAYKLLSVILGSGQSSRLNQEIVVKKSMSPFASAFTFTDAQQGMLVIGAEVRPDDLRSLIDITYSELRSVSKSVTQAELDRAKALVKTSLIGGIENNDSLCKFHASNLLTHNRLLLNDEILQKIDAVTLDDIKRLAGSVLRSNPSVSMIVPKGVDPALIPSHKEVLALRDGSGGTPALVQRPAPSGPKPG